MNVQELKSVVDKFKSKNRYSIPSKGGCEKYSRFLAEEIVNNTKCNPMIVFGYYNEVPHVWLTVNEEIIDVTKDQFEVKTGVYKVIQSEEPDEEILERFKEEI